jgi:hypothetical protein
MPVVSQVVEVLSFFLKNLSEIQFSLEKLDLYTLIGSF